MFEARAQTTAAAKGATFPRAAALDIQLSTRRAALLWNEMCRRTALLSCTHTIKDGNTCVMHAVCWQMLILSRSWPGPLCAMRSSSWAVEKTRAPAECRDSAATHVRSAPRGGRSCAAAGWRAGRRAEGCGRPPRRGPRPSPPPPPPATASCGPSPSACAAGLAVQGTKPSQSSESSAAKSRACKEYGATLKHKAGRTRARLYALHRITNAGRLGNFDLFVSLSLAPEPACADDSPRGIQGLPARGIHIGTPESAPVP